MVTLLQPSSRDSFSWGPAARNIHSAAFCAFQAKERAPLLEFYSRHPFLNPKS